MDLVTLRQTYKADSPVSSLYCKLCQHSWLQFHFWDFDESIEFSERRQGWHIIFEYYSCSQNQKIDRQRKNEGRTKHAHSLKINCCLLFLSESLSVSTDALFLLQPWLLSCPDPLSSSSCSFELLPTSFSGDDDCGDGEEAQRLTNKRPYCIKWN